MTQTETAPPPVPAIVPFLKRLEDGTPYLAGSRCEACGQIAVGDRRTCARCTARGQMRPVRLAETGKVWAFTVVHRSFPGVETPFVDVIVDMDDGSHLKGTLSGVTPDPAAIAFDLPVRVAYREATPVNTPGKACLTYHFVPA
jgi:uncharacterized OB-fold protein